MKRKTPSQKAEAELTKYALSLPDTDVVAGFATTRYLRVAGKGFCVFGERGEKPGEFTMTVKLPVAAEMVQELWFVRESKGWYKQHDWVIAHFDAEDDPASELPTLKAWVLQSYCAMAPKRLAKLVRGDA